MVSLGEQLSDKGQEEQVKKFKEKLPVGFESGKENEGGSKKKPLSEEKSKKANSYKKDGKSVGEAEKEIIEEFGNRGTIWENREGEKIMIGKLVLRATGKNQKSWRIIVAKKITGEKAEADDLSEEKLRTLLREGNYKRVGKSEKDKKIVNIQPLSNKKISALLEVLALEGEKELKKGAEEADLNSNQKIKPDQKLEKNLKTNQQEDKKKFPTLEEFKEKYEKYKNFIENKASYFSENGSWIRFDSYSEKNGQVTFYHKNIKIKKEAIRISVDLEEFEEWAAEYALEEDPTKKKPEQEELVESIGSVHPEIKGAKEKTEKEDKELERLEEAVAEARKKYVAKDYEVTNTLSRIKSVLGKNFSFKSNDEQATNASFNQYRIALNELLDYQMEKLKNSRSETEAELKSLIKYYNQDEKINLFEARTNARAEAWEKKVGKVPGYVLKKTGNFINSYRKMNWKKKMALGVALGLTGAGFLIVGQKMISGASVGFGVTTGLEAGYRKKESKRMSEKQKEIEKSLEKVKNPEEKYDLWMQKMQEEIDKSREDLIKEKNKASKRKLIGVATAVGIVSVGYLAKHLVHWGLEEVETEHYNSAAKKAYEKDMIERISNSFKKPEVSDMPAGGNNGAILPDGAGGSHQDVITPGNHAVVAPETEPADVTSGAENMHHASDVLIIEKGSSFQGVIIKHLEATGINHDEAGKMAHRMYLDYMENHPDPTGHDYNLVHPNARLEIGVGENGQPKILSFEDSPKSQWDKVVKRNTSRVRGMDRIRPVEAARVQTPNVFDSSNPIDTGDISEAPQTHPPVEETVDEPENITPSEGVEEAAKGAAKESSRISGIVSGAAGASAAGVGMAGKKVFENRGKIVSSVKEKAKKVGRKKKTVGGEKKSAEKKTEKKKTKKEKKKEEIPAKKAVGGGGKKTEKKIAKKEKPTRKQKRESAFEKMVKEYGFNEDDNFKKRTAAIVVPLISDDKEMEIIQSKRFSQIKPGDENYHIIERVKKVEENMVAAFGRKFKIKKKDVIFNWIVWVASESIKKQANKNKN